MELERVVDAYRACRHATEGVWYTAPLAGDRIFATKSAEGAFGLFLHGSAESFGPLPRSSAIAHESNVRIEPAGAVAPMLRVVAPRSAQGNRAMVYVACEACALNEATPEVGNDELLRRLHWMLVLLEDESAILSVERQRGLVGELQLLARLLRIANAGTKSRLLALERWCGSSSAKRDFAGPGVAVEVKTTSNPQRNHVISSLEQLDPHEPGEDVYVYSVGARHDSSAPRRLHHYVEDVEVQLSETELEVFRAKLLEYGYDWTRPDLYATEPGIAPFHLEPKLFAASSLDRLRQSSFVGGHPPAAASQISYRLLLTGEPLSLREEGGVFERLLSQD